MISAYLTVKELAALLHIKPQTLYAWAAQGKIPSVNFHGLVRFRADKIKEWVESLETKSSRPFPQKGSRLSQDDLDALIARAKQQVYTPPHGETRPASSPQERRTRMGLVKRGKIWWMTFTYQGKQVRRSTGTPDKRLADGILSKIKTEIIEGRYFEVLEEHKRTFDELMERFEQEHIPKKASQRAYFGYTKRLRGFFGSLVLAQVTPKVIVQYKNQRYADGVSPATINRELAVMKKAFNLARKEWEWCRDNPVSRVSLEKENNKRDRWLTHEEEARLLAACSPWVKEIVVFALNTGMRMGEILALTWAGVDLFRRTVTVFRSKNGERRTIPVNQTVLEILKEKVRVRSIHQDLVFSSQAGTMVDHNNLRRGFRAAIKTAKIADLHFHDLRHTFATRLTQGGIDLYKVQRLLGHKSPIMTQRYAHHYPETLRDGVEYLDRAKAVSTISAQSAGLAGGTIS